MSEPQSPANLLDGLLLGEPISSHHGVRSCPAIGAADDDRYMVKIISVPGAPGQVEALLLSGACADKDQALTYFKELADGVAQEAALLRRLGSLEGFEAHLGYEIQHAENAAGYEIRLLGRYHKTLATMIQKEPLTHLAAVNLGLDLCAALTACRRLGYIYVDLKPENVFYTEKHGYRIGDLGFMNLASLPYASLPEKYRSRYTAPEINDALSRLNSTMDIYALGLILYRIYNNGQFPMEYADPATALPCPMYADYEMAEIIAKACAPDPTDRWQDPAQMGQALVDYMQRNAVNATPIIPPLVLTAPAEELNEEFLNDEENAAELAPLLQELPEEIDPEQLAMDGTSQSLVAADPPESTETEETSIEEQADDDQLSFLDDLDDLDDEENTSCDDTYEALSDEVAQMLAHADDLIAHELPELVVAPGPIDVPIPPVILPEPEETAYEEPQEKDDAPHYDTEDAYLYDLPPKRKPKRWIALIAVALILIACAIGGYVWYQNIFLQSIDALTLQGEGTRLTVTLDTDTDEDLLSVICTDTYGNTNRSNVVGGVASFTDLTPATQYIIRVEISGLHKLTGNTSGIYTTQARTEILNFTAVYGPQDGSAILNFSVTGPEVTDWFLLISAPGEKDRSQPFSGHTVTVYDLTPGTEYLFRLTPAEDVPLAGQTEVRFTAQNLLRAEDLQITDCGDGKLTVQWAQPHAPAGLVWLLRCYNGADFDLTVTTTELSYTFTGLDHSTGYTVTVSAEGMPHSESVSVTADPIHVTGYAATAATAYALSVAWEFTGKAPENGWILCYTLNGQEYTIPCADNQAILALVPGGVYEFTARPADDITCFTQSGSFTAEEAVVFEGFGITAENLTAQLVLRPEGPSWSHGDLTADSYKTEFSAEEIPAIVLTARTNFSMSADPVNIVFAIRDEAAQLISAEQLSTGWSALWTGIHCTLDLNTPPQEPGSYTLDLYLNDQLLTTLQFTVI